MRAVTLGHLHADLTLGILDQEPALGPFHEDDESDDGERDDEDSENEEGRHLAGTAEFEECCQTMRETRDNAGEDDERSAVADTARGNLLAKPHQEHGAPGQRDDCAGSEEQAGIEHDTALPFETGGDAIGL